MTSKDMEAIRVAATLRFGSPIYKHCCNHCDLMPGCKRTPRGDNHKTSDDICVEYKPRWYRKGSGA
jgi:hypothetical protein